MSFLLWLKWFLIEYKKNGHKMKHIVTSLIFLFFFNLSYGQKTNWYLRVGASFLETTNLGFRVSEDSSNYKLGIDFGGFRYYRTVNAIYQHFVQKSKPYYVQGNAGVAVRIDPEWFDPTFYLLAGLRGGYEHSITRKLSLDVNLGGFTVIRQDQQTTSDHYPYKTTTTTTYPFYGRVTGSVGLLIKLN